MSEPSDPSQEKNALRDLIIGLGSRSVRKSYYPQLQQQIDALEKARQSAEENERKFRTLFEGLSDGVVVGDPESRRVQSVNPAFCKMLGYTEAELLQLTLADIHPPEALSRIIPEFPSLKQGFSVIFENLPFRRKDGTLVYTDANGTAIDFENKRCILGVCRDITERKLAEEALAQSEQKYRELVENANSIILRWTTDGTILFLNEFGQAFFGYSAEEIVGQPAIGTLVPESESTGRNLISLMAEIQENPQRYEHNINENIRRNGERVWIEWTNKVVRDAEGKMREILSIGSDVTERVRAEKELLRLNRLYAVLSQVNQAVIHAGSQRELLEEICRVAIEFGAFKMAWIGEIDPETQAVVPVASAGDAGGYLQKVHIYADERPEGRGPIGTSIREKRTYVCNDFQADPCTVPWREAASIVGFRAILSLPLRRGGSLFGSLAVYAGETDCFHAKEVALLEEVASDISFALDHLDQELRRQQDEQALKHAKEAAEAANRAKDQFIGVLSHELRTPLTPVLTAVALLKAQEKMSEEMRASVEIIHRNVQLEARLIDDLLDVTRISRGIIELHRETVDAHTCLMKTLEICRSEIVHKGMDVALSLRARQHHVWADPARLQQVFWNLLKNAVKFTPGNGRISLRTSNEDGRLRIEIADTGIGIDASVMPRIFNAFEQGEKTWTRRFGGLGLGLSIAKAIVELHGGKIAASSEGTDKGAVFTVELETVEAGPGGEGELPGAAPQKGGRRRILLVEDNADTLRILSRLLQKWGYAVACAEGVAQALELTGRESFDLLISDIGLPDGSGLEIMRGLRARHELPGIALSGYGTDDDIRESLAAGFAEHLTKPIGVDRLRSSIERLLSQPPQ